MGAMGTHRPSHSVGRMLKKVASFVLGLSASSTYPAMGKEPISAGSGLGGWKKYTSRAFFACGIAGGHFDHPVRMRFALLS